MKKSILLLILFLSASGLFAEITTLYKKKQNDRAICLIKCEDVSVFVNPNFIELETIEITEDANTFINCFVSTTDLTKEKEMKKITAKIANKKYYYETLKKMKLKQIDDDVIFENEKIYYVYQFTLE